MSRLRAIGRGVSSAVLFSGLLCWAVRAHADSLPINASLSVQGAYQGDGTAGNPYQLTVNTPLTLIYSISGGDGTTLGSYSGSVSYNTSLFSLSGPAPVQAIYAPPTGIGIVPVPVPNPDLSDGVSYSDVPPSGTPGVNVSYNIFFSSNNANGNGPYGLSSFSSGGKLFQITLTPTAAASSTTISIDPTSVFAANLDFSSFLDAGVSNSGGSFTFSISAPSGTSSAPIPSTAIGGGVLLAAAGLLKLVGRRRTATVAA